MKREKTLRQIIEKIVGGEVIEAVVIGTFTGDYYRRPDKEKEPSAKVKKKVLTWEKASKFLYYQTDYRYDGLTIRGFADFHFFTLWTPTRVFFVTLSNSGAHTRIVWVPRHPIPGDSAKWPVLELTVPRYK